MKKNKGLFGVYFCAYCKKPVLASNMEVDHILPVSKVGINHTANLVASCKECNRRKSDKIDHRVMLGFADKIIGMLLGFVVGLVLFGIKAIWTVIKLPITITAKTGKAIVLGKVLTAVIIVAIVLTAYYKISSMAALG